MALNVGDRVMVEVEVASTADHDDDYYSYIVSKDGCLRSSVYIRENDVRSITRRVVAEPDESVDAVLVGASMFMRFSGGWMTEKTPGSRCLWSDIVAIAHDRDMPIELLTRSGTIHV